jgi:anti-sigma-K factor RskA
MTTSDIHHLSAAYALDAVDEHERAAFEAHYGSCDVCRVDVVEFRETLAKLALADATPPPPAVKDRVMAEIGRTRQLSPLVPPGVTRLDARRNRRWTLPTMLATAAAAVAVVVAGVLAVVAIGRGDDAPAYADELAAVLASPDGQVADLDVTGAGAAAGDVRVAWSPSRGTAVVLASGLAEAPVGEAYELWLIGADGEPVPMELLDPAEDGDVTAVLDLAADAPAAWGVTLEPDAGSPAPTGDILFLTEV